MDIRKTNLIIGSAGGTAGKGSKTYKLSLPSAWVHELGFSEDSRKLELRYDGGQIIISKAMSLDEFAARQRARGHDVRMLRYYDGSTLCTSICADFSECILRAENHTPRLVKTAFGKKEYPIWEDFEFFLKERCIPPTRAGLREYLEAIGLDEYDPIEIIKKTSGRMAEDEQWLETEEI